LLLFNLCDFARNIPRLFHAKAQRKIKRREKIFHPKQLCGFLNFCDFARNIPRLFHAKAPRKKKKAQKNISA